jgi:hypothetical protein
MNLDHGCFCWDGTWLVLNNMMTVISHMLRISPCPLFIPTPLKRGTKMTSSINFHPVSNMILRGNAGSFDVHAHKLSDLFL